MDNNEGKPSLCLNILHCHTSEPSHPNDGQSLCQSNTLNCHIYEPSHPQFITNKMQVIHISQSGMPVTYKAENANRIRLNQCSKVLLQYRQYSQVPENKQGRTPSLQNLTKASETQALLYYAWMLIWHQVLLFCYSLHLYQTYIEGNKWELLHIAVKTLN